MGWRRWIFLGRWPNGEASPDLCKEATVGEGGVGFEAEEATPDLMAKGTKQFWVERRAAAANEVKGWEAAG